MEYSNDEASRAVIEAMVDPAACPLHRPGRHVAQADRHPHGATRAFGTR